MTLGIIIGLFGLGCILAVVAPFRALVVTVFLAPWTGLDVDAGLRVTAYLVFLVPLGLVHLLSVFHSDRAFAALRSVGLFWIIIVYAVCWSLLQIPFLPEATMEGGLMRSPEMRAMVQIPVFLASIAPIIIIPWLLRSVDEAGYLLRVYLVSVIVLAILGWIQMGMWISTGVDPFPIGFVDSLLGGTINQRSGQFLYHGDLIYRMSSFGGEPKGLGVGLAVGLLLLQSGVRPDIRGASAAWPFLFVSMLATFSTMAILAWFGASLMQLVLRAHRSLRHKGKQLVFTRRSLFVGILLLVAIPGAFVAFPGSPLFLILEMRTVDRLIGQSVESERGTGMLEDFNEAVVGFLVHAPGHAVAGVGLGNAHLYAEPFLPEYAVRYASRTPFVAKSYLLRWVSELGLLSLAGFLFWWIRTANRAARLSVFREDTLRMGRVLHMASLPLLAFWLVSGYITAQFFILTGILLGVRRILLDHHAGQTS